MAKVFGIHEVELRPGVTPEQFEQFYHDEWAQLAQFPGWRTYLLKGDRGERVGKYALLVEIESREARDHLAPDHHELSDEAQQAMARFGASVDKWKTLATFPSDETIYTDYQVIAD